MEALLSSTFIGNVGDSGVFRLNLAASGLSSIRSILLEDDNVISGGTGAASGFDLDMIKISTTLVDDPALVNGLPSLSAFSFNTSSVVFQPGFLQPYSFSNPSSANRTTLFGTLGSDVNFTTSTLDTLDGVNWTDESGVSIGEGGSIGFILNGAIAPDNLYLYIADVGGGNDEFRLTVSSTADIPLRTGVTLVGTEGSDEIDLETGINASLGLGDDVVNGQGGNDTIRTGPGRDILNGDEGDDTLIGGLGKDLLQGFSGGDVLLGGADRDKLLGGRGRDFFVFDIDARFKKRVMKVDKVLDFSRRNDTVVLDQSTFKRLKSTSFDRADFEQVQNNQQAKTSDALFTYIRRSGSLFYNENRDSAGFGKGGKFADFSNGLNLSANQFLVID